MVDRRIVVPPRALVFDSYFDPYRGVIIYCRMMEGALRAGDRVALMNTGREFTIEDIGVMSPGQVQTGVLHAGEVGYVSGGIKRVADARVLAQEHEPRHAVVRGRVEAPRCACWRRR